MMRCFALVFLLALGCGSSDDSESSSSPKAWTADQKSEGIGSCVLSAMKPGNDMPYATAQKYCGCIIDESSKRWGWDDFIAAGNADKYMAILTGDGTLQRCATAAK